MANSISVKQDAVAILSLVRYETEHRCVSIAEALYECGPTVDAYKQFELHTEAVCRLLDKVIEFAATLPEDDE